MEKRKRTGGRKKGLQRRETEREVCVCVCVWWKAATDTVHTLCMCVRVDTRARDVKGTFIFKIFFFEYPVNGFDRKEKSNLRGRKKEKGREIPQLAEVYVLCVYINVRARDPLVLK